MRIESRANHWTLCLYCRIYPPVFSTRSWWVGGRWNSHVRRIVVMTVDVVVVLEHGVVGVRRHRLVRVHADEHFADVGLRKHEKHGHVNGTRWRGNFQSDTFYQKPKGSERTERKPCGFYAVSNKIASAQSLSRILFVRSAFHRVASIVTGYRCKRKIL